jgi:hypothetical protein
VLILSFLLYLFCVWGFHPLCPSMQKSEEVYDQFWSCITLTAPSLQQIGEQPIQGSDPGVHFLHSFPINLSIAPCTVLFSFLH